MARTDSLHDFGIIGVHPLKGERFRGQKIRGGVVVNFHCGCSQILNPNYSGGTQRAYWFTCETHDGLGWWHGPGGQRGTHRRAKTATAAVHR